MSHPWAKLFPVTAGVPIPQADDLPECHADGTDPAGYEAAPDCEDCVDKPTCYVRSKLLGLTLDAVTDGEVEALRSGDITHATMAHRQRTRLGLRDRGKRVRVELLPAAVTPTVRPAIRLDGRKDRHAPRRDPVARLGATKAPASPDLSASPVYRPTPLTDDPRAPWGRLASGDPVPKPRKVADSAELVRVLRSTSRAMRLPFVLEPGMRLRKRKVRGDRIGETIEVKVEVDGFWIDGFCFRSLSSAVMFAERRQATGSDFFGTWRRNTEVLSSRGIPLWANRGPVR